jgi:ABC-type Fe3+-citrate transport system substrate-binding protein
MQNIVNSLSPIFSYIKFIKTEDKDEKIKEANNIISEFKNKSKELEKSIKDAEGIIENVKKTAQQEEIKKFGRFFEKISEKNQKNAKNNFRYMIASVLITLFLAFIFI